jgi:hypothetical protein
MKLYRMIVHMDIAFGKVKSEETMEAVALFEEMSMMKVELRHRAGEHLHEAR